MNHNHLHVTDDVACVKTNTTENEPYYRHATDDVARVETNTTHYTAPSNSSTSCEDVSAFGGIVLLTRAFKQKRVIFPQAG